MSFSGMDKVSTFSIRENIFRCTEKAGGLYENP
jgi:hypothetical protein